MSIYTNWACIRRLFDLQLMWLLRSQNHWLTINHIAAIFCVKSFEYGIHHNYVAEWYKKMNFFIRYAAFVKKVQSDVDYMKKVYSTRYTKYCTVDSYRHRFWGVNKTLINFISIHQAYYLVYLAVLLLISIDNQISWKFRLLVFWFQCLHCSVYKENHLSLERLGFDKSWSCGIWTKTLEVSLNS